MIITDTSIAFDPRPDLVGDSWLWEYLLSHIEDRQNQALFHGFRCAGFCIKARNGTPFLEPTILPGIGFSTTDEYNVFKESWMAPKAETIKAILAKIGRTFKIDAQGNIHAN